MRSTDDDDSLLRRGADGASALPALTSSSWFDGGSGLHLLFVGPGGSRPWIFCLLSITPQRWLEIWRARYAPKHGQLNHQRKSGKHGCTRIILNPSTVIMNKEFP